MKKRTRKGKRAMALVSTRKALGAWQAVVCDELKELEEIITHEWMHWYYRNRIRKVDFYYPKIDVDEWKRWAVSHGDTEFKDFFGIPGVGKTEITIEFAAQHSID